jgi:hypothetical protein
MRGRAREMATEVRDRAERLDQEIARSHDHRVSKGEALGLYEALARVGPATFYRLAREALVPRDYAYWWLETQAHAGYVHRDSRTGRYSLWCDLA